MGVSSSPSSAKERGSPTQALVSGQTLPSLAEVPEAAGPWLRSSSALGAKDYSGRASKPPLKVLPISIWSPPSQSANLPPRMPEDMGRDRFRAAGNEDSLLTNAELAAEAVSSILRDSDLKKVDALSAEKALALSLQGSVSVCQNAFIHFSHRYSNISANLFSFFFFFSLFSFFFFLADGYVYEESGEEG